MPERSLPRVGVFHAPEAAVNLHDLIRAARGRCEPVLIVREPVARAHPAFMAMARRLAAVATVPGDAPPEAVAELGLTGVTTFHDNELSFADAAVAHLGLPGAGTVQSPWDKLVQRRLLSEAGVTRLRVAAVDSEADLLAGVAAVGLPAVLKPRRGTSSVGVSFLLGPQDVEHQRRHRPSWRGLVLETYAEPATHPSGVAWLGDYVSVETVSDDRGRHHVTITDKIPLSISGEDDSPLALAVREAGDVLPSRLPPAVYEQAVQLTSLALDALGVRQRVTHTELKITAGGFEVIEVNGRLGGEVSRLVATIGGPDMTAAALTVAQGLPADLTTGRSADPEPPCVACLYIPFESRHGTVASDVTTAQLRALPGVVAVDAVAAHGAPRSDTGFRAASLTVEAPDLDQLDSRLADVLAGIRVLFEKDGVDRDPWITRTHALLLSQLRHRTGP